jgi:phosphoheptose isomerase
MTTKQQTIFRLAHFDVQAYLRQACALEAQVIRAAQLVSRCLRSGGKLLLCGNGGSACDATHLATEFLCRFQRDRAPYPALSLSANGDYLTAVVNDYAADEIFARQIRALGRVHDGLIVFSTSGNSPNIGKALAAGRHAGMTSIAFLGRTGGAVKGQADVELLVAGENTARIQETHQFLFHALCELVEEDLV